MPHEWNPSCSERKKERERDRERERDNGRSRERDIEMRNKREREREREDERERESAPRNNHPYKHCLGMCVHAMLILMPKNTNSYFRSS